MSKQANLQEGRVVNSHGRHCVVESADGTRRICHPRGKKNQAVVGDKVMWLAPAEGQGDEGTIEKILPRDNLFYRQDEIRTKAFAANIDQILILLAAEPVFSESQLAKALIAAQEQGIRAIIGLNKQDLAPAFEQAWARLAAYRIPCPDAEPMYQVLRLNLKAPNGGDDYPILMEELSGKATLVLGPSGVGKSTLINRLVPEAQAQTAEISQALNSGKHTTTTTSWYWFQTQTDDSPNINPSAILDSPGFQEFGLNHIQRQELARWMPDIHAHTGNCRFYNCTHLHEPGCSVQAAVQDEAAIQKIASSRYQLYQRLFSELPNT